MTIGIDINNHEVKIVEMKGDKVTHWASLPLEPGLVHDGLVAQPKIVGKIIAQLLESVRVQREKIVASLAGLPFTYRFMNLPVMKRSLLEEAVYRAAKKEFSLPLDDLYISWFPLTASNNEQPVFVLGIPRNLIDALADTFKAAGVKASAIELRPLALARVVNQENFIAINLEADSFDIVVVVGGIPRVLHTINPRGEGSTLEDNIHRLADELAKTTAFYNRTQKQDYLTPETPLFLTGELTAESAAAALLQTEIDNPIESLNPTVVLAPDIPFGSYAITIGLAMKKGVTRARGSSKRLLFHDINVNLMAGKYRKAKDRPQSLRYWALAVLLVIAALSLILLNRAKSNLNSMNESLINQLNNVTRQINLANIYADEASLVEETILQLSEEEDMIKSNQEAVLGARGSYSREMAIVTKAMPYDARFVSLDIIDKEIIILGVTESQFSAVDYAVALENTGAFQEVRIHELDDTILFTGESDNVTGEFISSSGIIFEIRITR